MVDARMQLAHSILLLCSRCWGRMSGATFICMVLRSERARRLLTRWSSEPNARDHKEWCLAEKNEARWIRRAPGLRVCFGSVPSLVHVGTPQPLLARREGPLALQIRHPSGFLSLSSLSYRGEGARHS